jgi:hypothetical protein
MSGTAAMLLVILWKPYTGFLSISAILRYIHHLVILVLVHLRHICGICLMELRNGISARECCF